MWEAASAVCWVSCVALDVTSQRAAHLLAPTRNWLISNLLRKAGTNPAIAVV